MCVGTACYRYQGGAGSGIILWLFLFLKPATVTELPLVGIFMNSITCLCPTCAGFLSHFTKFCQQPEDGRAFP